MAKKRKPPKSSSPPCHVSGSDSTPSYVLSESSPGFSPAVDVLPPVPSPVGAFAPLLPSEPVSLPVIHELEEDVSGSLNSETPATECSVPDVPVRSVSVSPPLNSSASQFDVGGTGSATFETPAIVIHVPVPDVSVTTGDVSPPKDPSASQAAISGLVPDATLPVPAIANQTGLSTTAPIPASSPGSLKAAEIWKGFRKGSSPNLVPTETPFILESGEACVTIPNEVVEKNKKAWESFIIGQFYDDAPARAAVHAIVNGIWSRQKRDISVSKMDGNAFLFRVPCPLARRRILSQSLWQIDGQTMFVAKWSPGLQQEKPALTMVPVWLEFSGVPLQFFNRDALKEIAGLVGHPICLHPTTENLTNIEVAKVYTVIDPTKHLPNYVNASFESGDIRRISVSCPWLPSICSHCKKVGHTISRCKSAPPTCSVCNSVKHSESHCPRSMNANGNLGKGISNKGKGKSFISKGKAPIKSLLPIVSKSSQVYRVVRVNNENSGDRSPSSKDVVNAPAAGPAATAPAQAPPLLKGAPSYANSVTAPSFGSVQDRTLVSASSSHALALLPILGTSSPSKHVSDSPVVTDHDLEEGEICVDLTGFGESSYSPLSSVSGSSESESLSGDEDNPADDSDKFIEVFSRRFYKKSKAKANARVRGPLIL
ncbi:unnamed protein product [Brassica napus]|nr:unnamed protein product [Brassica napus]VDC93954.1 unnamed protein product [Brassica oleracea]